MLLPFSEKLMIVEDFYVPFFNSFIRDAKEQSADFCGYFILANENNAWYLLMDEGKPTAFAMYDSLLDTIVPYGDRAQSILSNTSLRCTVMAMECDEGLSKMLRTVLNQPPTFRIDEKTDGKWVSERLEKLDLAVEIRNSEQIVELALYAGGKFVVGYRYDHGVGSYQRDNEEGWIANAHPGIRSFIEVPNAPYPVPNFSDDYDPLDATVQKYAVVLNKVQEILLKIYGPKTMQGTQMLLEGLKKKYPPLYRGVAIDEQTGKINWQQLGANRMWVNVDYRYEKFFLYLDEVLLKMVAALREKTGSAGSRQLLDFVKRLHKVSPDARHPITNGFFQKINSLLQGNAPG